MKKQLSLLLALVLVIASVVTINVTATAEGSSTFVLPKTVERMKAQLPVREDPAVVRTLTKNGLITVVVNGECDKLMARWLGYNEDFEEVELEDGRGYIETEGHKYQLGARWNNTVYSWYTYNGEDILWYYTNEAGTPVEFVYDLAEDENGEPVELTCAANDPNLEKYSWGRESNGAPNEAYELTDGEWVTIYSRAGKVMRSTKTEDNTDYFKMGVAGAQGTVTWRNKYARMKKDPALEKAMYISEVKESYPEGDIAEITAQFNSRGNLTHYFVTYRTGEEETYRIKYGPKNDAQYGWYTGVDRYGDEIHAYTASRKKWADSETHELTDTVMINWDLKPFLSSLFQNPPRKTR